MKKNPNKKSFAFGILIAAVLAVVALIVTAFNIFLPMPFGEETDDYTPLPAAKENIKKVAIIAPDLSDALAYSEATSLAGRFSLNEKISASLFDARFSAEKQAQYIAYCIQEGFHAMVVFPIDLEYIKEGLQKASESGVLCVLAGSEAYGETYNAVYYDNATTGELIGQYLQASMRSDATAVIVYDKRGLAKTTSIDEAISYTLKNLKRVRIKEKLYSAESNTETLLQKLETLSPDTVILCDEARGLYLAQVMRTRNFSGNIILASSDEKAPGTLLSGKLSALVYKDIQKRNNQVYNIIIKGIQGKPSGGRIALYPELLNAHNIKDYMAQRYQNFTD